MDEQHAWESAAASLGDDHPDTLAAAAAFARALVRLGRYGEALEVEEALVERAQRALGEDDLTTLMYQINLASTLGLTGAYELGYTHANTAWETLRARVGEIHPETLRAMNNATLNLNGMGEYERAMALQEEGLEHHIEVYGDDHVETLKMTTNLASLRASAGALTDAIALERDVRERAKRELNRRIIGLGAAHDDDLPLEVYQRELRIVIASSSLNLAAFLLNDKALRDAKDEVAPLFDDAISARRASLGDAHPETVSAMMRARRFHLDCGNHAQYDTLSEAVIEAFTEALGPDSPAIFEIMHDQALVWARLREYTRAETRLEALIARCEHVYGADHPNTRAVMRSLTLVRCLM